MTHLFKNIWKQYKFNLSPYDHPNMFQHTLLLKFNKMI